MKYSIIIINFIRHTSRPITLRLERSIAEEREKNEKTKEGEEQIKNRVRESQNIPP